MFDWLKRKKARPVDYSIRDTLFGDMAVEQWPRDAATEPPWTHFVEARNVADRAKATASLRQVLSSPDLESRHYLQAWHELRRLGVTPPPDAAKQLLGVVVEVGMDQGLDILAAYADRSARYFNFSGSAVIWERPDHSLDQHIERLFAAARAIVEQIGPWDGPRPPAPPRGQARISMLTPSGLLFGQAQFEILARDPLAGPAIMAATELMQALLAKAETSPAFH